jgi:hypothetical protein
MLYYLFDWLSTHKMLPGAGVFTYIAYHFSRFWKKNYRFSSKETSR